MTSMTTACALRADAAHGGITRRLRSQRGSVRRENAIVVKNDGGAGVSIHHRRRAHLRQHASSVGSIGSIGSTAASTTTTTTTTTRRGGLVVTAAAAAPATEPPALSNPESGSKAKDIGVRRGAVPYKDEAVDCDILVNDAARDAVKAAGADRFVQFVEPTNPKLVKLLTIMEEGWDRVGVRNKNAGHHSLWPEAFAAGKALLEEAFPEECDPAYGGEVLSGVAFVDDANKDRAIDFMQRRPKTDFTMSKYNPLGRLHRDPDAIDYKSPGWMESAMPGSKNDTIAEEEAGPSIHTTRFRST